MTAAEFCGAGGGAARPGAPEAGPGPHSTSGKGTYAWSPSGPLRAFWSLRPGPSNFQGANPSRVFLSGNETNEKYEVSRRACPLARDFGMISPVFHSPSICPAICPYLVIANLCGFPLGLDKDSRKMRFSWTQFYRTLPFCSGKGQTRNV